MCRSLAETIIETPPPRRPLLSTIDRAGRHSNQTGADRSKTVCDRCETGSVAFLAHLSVFGVLRVGELHRMRPARFLLLPVVVIEVVLVLGAFAFICLGQGTTIRQARCHVTAIQATIGCCFFIFLVSRQVDRQERSATQNRKKKQSAL